MKNILLKIEYDGTGFSGWQRQPEQRTVQGELERVLSILCAQDIQIDGTGRTDAGVHAIGQCASFEADFRIPVDRIPRAANDLLAESRMVTGDIRVVSAEEKEPGFHARHSAIGKTYVYRLYNAESMPPFLRNFRYFVKRPLDIEAMKQAAKAFVGKKDFRTFMAAAPDFTGSTEKTIYGANIIVDGPEVDFAVTGSGFLYNMVRIMAGTLVDVGLGRIRADEMEDIVASLDRARAGHTAPPQGLFMKQVYFDEVSLRAGAMDHGKR